jgi:hypothetical protein
LKKPAAAAAGIHTCSRLEAELGSEANPQVVVSTVIEVYVVARFEPKTDGSCESFKSSARIYRKLGYAIVQAYNASESGRRVLIVYGEVIKADFAGYGGES